MSQYYNSSQSAFNSLKTNHKAKQKVIGCKKCGKKHEDGCFDINGAVRRQFIREFNRFMED